MTVPVIEFRKPFMAVPYVADGALTVAIDVVSRPAVQEVRWRIYPGIETPPAFTRRPPTSLDPEYTEFVTSDGLQPNTTYVIEVQIQNADGFDAAIDSVIWDPPSLLYPAADVSLGVGPRPWEFEDYKAQWMAGLAWYYRDDPFFNNVLARLAEEFQRLAAATEEVSRLIMPSRAYGRGLGYWEDLLGLASNDPNASESSRRQSVMAHLKSRVNNSAITFLQTLQAVQGADPQLTEDFPNYSVGVTLTGGDEFQATLEKIIERIKPAHIAVSFNYQAFAFAGPRRRVFIFPLWHRSRSTLTTTSGTGFDVGRFGL